MTKALNLQLLAVLLLVVFSTIIQAMFFFDVTDESFALNWAKEPFIYSSSVTMFGYLLHPIYSYFDGNITLYRYSGIFSAAVVNVFLLLKLSIRNCNFFGKNKVVIFFLFLVSFYSLSKIYTPNYNSLVYFSLSLCALGLCFENKHLSGLTLAFSGFVCVLSKPTSGVLLAVVLLLYFFYNNFKIKDVFYIVILALIFVFSFIYNIGGVDVFFEMVINGVNNGGTLTDGAAFSIFRLDLISFYLLPAILIMPFLGFFIWISFKYKFGYLISCFLLLAISFLVSIIPYSSFVIVPVKYTFLLFIIMVVIYLFKNGKVKNKREFSLGIIIFLMPYIYAFGTSNNYVNQSFSLSFFYVLSTVIFVNSLGFSDVIKDKVISLLVVTFSFYVLFFSLHNWIQPYRSPSVIGANVVNIGTTPPLYVESNVANYFNNIKLLAYKNGFESGTPVIDLTGQSPGVIYYLNGSAIGAAWSLGGYPGSLQFYLNQLKTVPCEQLKKAWILVEDGGDRMIPLSMLSDLGLNPLDYIQIGRFKVPENFAGKSIDKKNKRTQYFLLPKGSDKYCE